MLLSLSFYGFYELETNVISADDIAKTIDS